MNNKGYITVSELLEACKQQVKKGNGDKGILISSDDEGNSFHPLFYCFTDSKEDIQSYKYFGLLQDDSDADSCILLG